MSTAVQPAPPGVPRTPTEDRSSGSFLVRIWYETREIEGSTPAFRGYIKNLHTGGEHFVRDPASIGETIGRSCGGPREPAPRDDGTGSERGKE